MALSVLLVRWVLTSRLQVIVNALIAPKTKSHHNHQQIFQPASAMSVTGSILIQTHAKNAFQENSKALLADVQATMIALCVHCIQILFQEQLKSLNAFVMRVTRVFTATRVFYVLLESMKMKHMFALIVLITVIPRVVPQVFLIVNVMQALQVLTAAHAQLALQAHTKPISAQQFVHPVMYTPQL